CPLGMPGAQGPIGSILHHQKRGLVLKTKVEHADDMSMLQVRDSASLTQKLLMRLWLHGHMENLDGSKDLQVAMLCQIDLGKCTAPKQAQQLIIAKELSHTLSHT